MKQRGCWALASLALVAVPAVAEQDVESAMWSAQLAEAVNQPVASLSRVNVLVGGFVEAELADIVGVKVKPYVELRFQKR